MLFKGVAAMQRFVKSFFLLVFSIICIPSATHSQNPKLVFSTLLGGSGGDGGYDQKIVVDKQKYIYTMGLTQSIDFPVTPDAYDSTFISSENMFVIKLDPSGSSIIYSTFLAGSGREKPTGFQVDDEGNAYISGTTGSGYPQTPGSYFSDVPFNPQEIYDRVFLTKLNPSGSALVYSIVFGAAKQYVRGHFLGLDGEGHAYVMGDVNYGEIETTHGALQEQPPDVKDAFSRPFICKFSRDGSKLEYATYFGGPTKGPEVRNFTVDRKGNAYLTGISASGDFPITENCYSSNPPISSSYQFLSKIDPSGTKLVYSTFLTLFSHGIAVDDSEHVYIGYDSQKFPVTPGVYNTDTSQGYGFCKFAPEGNRLVYSTRIFEYAGILGVDSLGRTYIGGNTNGKDKLPVTLDAYDESFNGGANDIYFCVFDPAGSKLLYATYFGGTGDDVCTDFTVVGTGEVYLTGFTTSPDFPTTDGAYCRTRKGESDIFICKFSFAPGPVKVEAAPRTFSLSSAYPNPFNPSTTISFSLPAPGYTSLAVYDITGRKVRALVFGPMSAGEHTVTWDGKDDAGKPAASGVYISRLAAGERLAAGKMVLVR